MTQKREYSAVRVKQTASSGDLVLFAAPATDIDDWSGIPQRERMGDDETVGFQREENPKRLKDLESFYSDPDNIIQNPLLCASLVGTPVAFRPDGEAEGSVVSGKIEIEWEDLGSLSLLEILTRLKDVLENRVPDLKGKQVADGLLNKLRERLNAEHPEHAEEVPEELDEDEDEDGGEFDSQDDSEDVTAALFTDETHIADFWEEVSGRAQILKELEPGGALLGDSFLGFSKDAMSSYLQPIVVVDGQHRLRGALQAAESSINSDEHEQEIQAEIDAGADPDEVSDRIRRREARLLPISLLLETSPEEHVFQFVVVNQKATPIAKALLGTIVSTSLSAAELGRVSERLKAAGIPLEDSRAIAYLTRASDSPFKDLVERGMSDDTKDLLPWNVLGSLVRIFRDLKGGKLFHEKVDYADKWRRDQLDQSALVSSGATTSDRKDLWSADGGPWREVLTAFFCAVRDKLGTVEDADAGNFWGAPRKSNLFNKVSLTILAADFFQYLGDRGKTLNSKGDVQTLVKEWLGSVKVSYFSRDWKLSGVKKDAPGTRSQWSYLWVQYRKDPQKVPGTGEFRKNRGN